MCCSCFLYYGCFYDMYDLYIIYFFFVCKQTTAYEVRISDWSSDVCSSDLLSAPDLALTQISVEVVSVILLLLALNFLPKETPVESSSLRRLPDAALAGISGVRVTGLIYLVMTRGFTSLSAYHLARSTTARGGTHVANVILVDQIDSASAT